MNYDRRGLIGTIIIHLALLIYFLIAGFSTPLPLPAEQGMLINFGDSEQGFGPEEPTTNMDETSNAIPSEDMSKPSADNAEEEIMTQDFEESVALNSSESKSVPKETTENPKETEAKEAPVEEKKVNKRALYKGRNNNTQNTGSEGISSNQGNQGSPDGSVNSDNYSKGNSSGNGVSFSLSGRNPLSLPRPDFDHQKEGRVVVEVKVDRSGKVISAVPGIKGSTTLDSYLLRVAKEAALASRFDSKPNAPFYQVGTITYIFRLN